MGRAWGDDCDLCPIIGEGINIFKNHKGMKQIRACMIRYHVIPIFMVKNGVLLRTCFTSKLPKVFANGRETHIYARG